MKIKLRVILIMSVILNVILVSCLLNNILNSKEENTDINSVKKFTDEIVKEEIIVSSNLLTTEVVSESTTENTLNNEISIESLNSWIEQREREQLFYGYWKIEEAIAPNYALPSRYSRFDDNGNYIGLEYYKLIGKYLTIEKDYIQCDGKKYYYAYKPNIVVYPLDTVNEQGNSPFHLYNYKSLGLTGDTYPIVYFMLIDNFDIQKNKNFHGRDILVSDFEKIFIKDKNTMYISNGDLMFLMRRM